MYQRYTLKTLNCGTSSDIVLFTHGMVDLDPDTRTVLALPFYSSIWVTRLRPGWQADRPIERHFQIHVIWVGTQGLGGSLEGPPERVGVCVTAVLLVRPVRRVDSGLDASTLTVFVLLVDAAALCFSELVHKLAKENLLMVTWANDNHFDFVMNWVKHLQKLKVRRQRGK